MRVDQRTNEKPTSTEPDGDLHVGREHSKTWMLWIAGLAVTIGAQHFGDGLALDDHGIMHFVREHLRGAPQPRAFWNLFEVCGRANPAEARLMIFTGLLPWWSAPDLRIAFLRPLAVASHYIDGLLWPDSPWMLHLHNSAWYVLIVILAGLLYRRLLPAPTAALATLLYTVNESHNEGVAWIASRNTLMTATFVLIALLAYETLAREGGRARALGAALSLLCAHASSEGALCAWPYLLGLAITPEPGSTRLVTRVRRLAPLAAVSCGWQAIAVHYGFVIRSSGIYIDPRDSPASFAEAVTERLPSLLRFQLTIPSQLEHWLIARGQHWIVGALGLLVVIMALIMLPIAVREAGTRTLALGFLGSSLLMCAAPVDSRLWFLPGLGAHGLLARAIVLGVQQSRTPGYTRNLPIALTALLLTFHVPLAAYRDFFGHNEQLAMERAARSVASALPPGDGPLIILNTPNYLFAVVLAVAPIASRPVYFLGASTLPVKLSRPAPDAFVLEPAGGYLREVNSRLTRSPRLRFTEGEQIDVHVTRITVQRVTGDGRPARVQFEQRGLANLVNTWATWNPRSARFEPAMLPAVGSSVWLPGAEEIRGPGEKSAHGAFGR